MCGRVCACVCVSPEALKSQLDQGEEKTSKMKQLLVKTKKDLGDAKKQVCFSVCVRVCVCVCKCILYDFLLLCVLCLMNVNSIMQPCVGMEALKMLGIAIICVCCHA